MEITFWYKDWNQLTIDEKADYCVYKKIPFLSDNNREYVETLYYSESHRNR